MKFPNRTRGSIQKICYLLSLVLNLTSRVVCNLSPSYKGWDHKRQEPLQSTHHCTAGKGTINAVDKSEVLWSIALCELESSCPDHFCSAGIHTTSIIDFRCIFEMFKIERHAIIRAGIETFRFSKRSV